MFLPCRRILSQCRGFPISAVAATLDLNPCCETRRSIAKHYNPKWKKERGRKFIKVDLPDFDEPKREAEMTPDEMRAKMKEKGIMPPRPWIERPLNISCTGAVIEAYVPPEGDGKISLVSVPGAKQKMQEFEKKGKSMLAIRKIRNFDEEFNHKVFAEKAHEMYIEAHQALAGKDEDKLHELVTERCFPEMYEGLQTKTLCWDFLELLEAPRVVHVRCVDVITKENVYAQVTVRIHSKQTMAIYDRFGRLLYGSKAVAKDALEYVVFEKHLANIYGVWRIHAKIIPEWMPPADPFVLTYVKRSQDASIQ